MKCIPCRVTVNGTRYEISGNGTVRETWRAVKHEDGTEDGTRLYGEPVAPAMAVAVRAEAMRQRRNRNARERSQAMRDIGLRRTRTGAWE